MLFSSITFLYIFLPLTLLLYALVPSKGRNVVLLAMSLLFYAWGEPLFVFLMLAEILLVYVLTLFHNRVCHALSVIVPFGILFFFKFSDIFPIGISFYTFQLVSYSIDVWTGRVARQKNLLTLAAYVALFPQLVAGPIVRYSDVQSALARKEKNCDTHVNMEYGIVRFCVGLGKKVLIANVLGEFVAEAAALTDRGLALSWCYAAAVSLQIYFDFSGYSDMAIGLGRMLGFHFPENFRYPFISGSISEFWHRWHITLGAWFRDYLYIPLGGSRVGRLRWIFNILVVWGFTGLWHGAEWNFILWGLMFAALLVVEKLVGRPVEESAVLGVARHVGVLFFILVSFLIFHNTDLGQAWFDIKSLWHVGGAGASAYVLRNRLGILFIGIVGATPFPAMLWGRLQKWLRIWRGGDIALHLLRAAFSVAVLMVCTAYIVDGSFNPFLYFRF
ncbi:MAG: MBOAT family protein [Roseburia sp.]|nr:MBOAT family protein [Roseburia sp.]